MVKRTDDTPRFTEADLRAAHKEGWYHRDRCSPSYKGGYKASFWDFAGLRATLGLGPRAKKDG
jgi:hypothetical protein